MKMPDAPAATRCAWIRTARKCVTVCARSVGGSRFRAWRAQLSAAANVSTPDGRAPSALPLPCTPPVDGAMALRCRAPRIEFCCTGLALVVLCITQWAVQQNPVSARVYVPTNGTQNRKQQRDPSPPYDEAPLAIWLGGRGISVPGCAVDCYAQPHADLGGEPLVAGPRNLLDSASACCEACRAHRTRTEAGRGCNVWVWCGDAGGCGASYRHCWLKRQPAPMVLPSVGALGGQVRWMSGVWADAAAVEAARAAASRPSPSVAAGAELALATPLGAVRLKLNAAGSPKAVSWLRGLARAPHRCHGCRFYRAEPGARVRVRVRVWGYG